MRALGWAKRAFHRYLGEVPPHQNPHLRDDPDVLSIGSRAYCRLVMLAGRPHLCKVFTSMTPGREAFACEKRAHRLFAKYPWMVPWVKRGLWWFVRPFYPDESRLDRLAERLELSARRRLAAEVLSIILDLYVEGCAHRDIHARNLFCVEGQLKLVDFETMTPYSAGHHPPFLQSYDITGRGLDSPHNTRNMGFSADNPASVARVLGVGVEEGAEQLRAMLKEELREASRTFRSHRSQRHTCRAQRIYGSFSLPQLTVEPAEAQRNSARRLERFGIGDKTLAGKRVLDLGSNVGAMIFEMQRFHPAESLGIEYDTEKVAVARRVAAFSQLDGVQFLHGDVETLTSRSFDHPYDVTFCLALEAHLKKPQRTYKLLGWLTAEVLYFEGNATTDPERVRRLLSAAGFRRIESLGLCDDDCIPDNNRRPLLRAWK